MREMQANNEASHCKQAYKEKQYPTSKLASKNAKNLTTHRPRTKMDSFKLRWTPLSLETKLSFF